MGSMYALLIDEASPIDAARLTNACTRAFAAHDPCIRAVSLGNSARGSIDPISAIIGFRQGVSNAVRFDIARAARWI